VTVIELAPDLSMPAFASTLALADAFALSTNTAFASAVTVFTAVNTNGWPGGCSLAILTAFTIAPLVNDRSISPASLATAVIVGANTPERSAPAETAMVDSTVCVAVDVKLLTPVSLSLSPRALIEAATDICVSPEPNTLPSTAMLVSARNTPMPLAVLAAAISAEIAGAVVSPVAKIKTASTIGSLATRGAVEGAVYGAGKAEGIEDIPQKAAEGAAFGAIGAGIIGTGGWLLLRKIDVQQDVDYTVNYETIGRQNATVFFLDTLYDVTSNKTGFDATSFDARYYDIQPITETRIILETLRIVIAG